jgi:hypothetical protein
LEATLRYVVAHQACHAIEYLTPRAVDELCAA